MSSPSSTVRLGPLRFSQAAAGACCCLVAMLGYSMANGCMRRLSGLSCDSAWAVCNKELIAFVAVGPWLLWQAWRRKDGLPAGRPLAILIAAGLATELIGNLGVQWGYEVVGLAVMIPADTGFVLAATAILGWLLLGEHVSPRNLAAVGVLILAVVLLGMSAAQANPATATPTAPTAPVGAALIAAALVVAAAAGIVFALLGIAVRYCVTGKTSPAAVVVIITATGVLTLGPLSLYRAGAAKLMATPWQQYAWMYSAGLCNLFAFFALIRGLQLTTVLHANMINAGQVASAAVMGVIFFGESCNAWLVLGVSLMITGILAFGSPVDQEAIDAHV
jgi:drug/metabolite transporter (DMT)-like permease